MDQAGNTWHADTRQRLVVRWPLTPHTMVSPWLYSPVCWRLELGIWLRILLPLWIFPSSDTRGRWWHWQWWWSHLINTENTEKEVGDSQIYHHKNSRSGQIILSDKTVLLPIINTIYLAYNYTGRRHPLYLCFPLGSGMLCLTISDFYVEHWAHYPPVCALWKLPDHIYCSLLWASQTTDWQWLLFGEELTIFRRCLRWTENMGGEKENWIWIPRSPPVQ